MKANFEELQESRLERVKKMNKTHLQEEVISLNEDLGGQVPENLLDNLYGEGKWTDIFEIDEWGEIAVKKKTSVAEKMYNPKITVKLPKQ